MGVLEDSSVEGRWQRARDRGVAVWPGRVAVRLGQLLSTNPTDTITDFSWLCVFQEVHELFQDYELKYCYVDRNKRTGERSVPSTSSCFDFAWSRKACCVFICLLPMLGIELRAFASDGKHPTPELYSLPAVEFLSVKSIGVTHRLLPEGSINVPNFNQ